MVSNPEKTFLPPIQENEFLPPISRWTTFGGMFILLVLSLSVPMASVVKYKVTVRGEAVVRPAGELRVVQAATEGQVMQIYVKENQKLQIGDIIATVDDSRLQTKRKQLQTNIEQARLEQVQTVAQIRALDSQMRYQRDRTHRTIASAQAELKGREYAYQEKKITSITELQEAEVNVKIAQEELYAGQAQLQSALANLRATEASLGAAISKQKRYESVAIKPTFRTSRSNINKLHSPVIQNYSKKN